MIPHPARVLVTADTSLVAESVRSALRDLGLDAEVLVEDPTRPDASPQHPDAVGLVVSDLDDPLAVRRVEMLLRSQDRVWVVSTAAAPGPVWGAVLDAGAHVVTPSWSSLRQLSAVLQEAAGGLCSPDGAERQRLIEAGRLGVPMAAQRPERLRTLSTREHQVLRLLFSGQTVRHIAPLLDISEGTVRAHVKAMLRKLGVSSQLAAVALYGQLRLVGAPPRAAEAPVEDEDDLDTPHP